MLKKLKALSLKTKRLLAIASLLVPIIGIYFFLNDTGENTFLSKLYLVIIYGGIVLFWLIALLVLWLKHFVQTKIPTTKITSVKSFIKEKIYSLDKTEAIVVSVVIGAVIFLILGYCFGQSEYYWYNHYDKKNMRVSKEIYDEARNDSITYSSFTINYALGFIGFIISSGLSYLFLNKNANEIRKNK